MILDTQFPLLAFGRFEGLVWGRAGIGRGLEGLRVGQIRYEARVENVTDRRIAAEIFAALGVGCIFLVVIGSARMDPILTTAEGQAPLIKGHLILYIQSGLDGLLVVVVEGIRARRADDWLAINRVVDVDWRGRSEDRCVSGIGTLVIKPDQQGMADSTGVEVSLQVVVYCKLADVFVSAGGRTSNVALIIHLAERIGADSNGLE
ncbi:hypothetical protein D3C77_368030 [compost metagenome]